MKLRSLLDQATATLNAAGVESPRVDAELLLAHVLEVERTGLRTRDDVDGPALDRFAALIERRSGREPLQYLTGDAPFRFVTVTVGPGVFIPRPETELLVDAVLLDLCHADSTPIVVDLCSGSGALAISIADEMPNARVLAVERSPQALPWLRRNCASTSIEVVAADIGEPGLLADLYGAVDAIVSNPPYVPQRTVVGAEVAHDPAEAVFAGDDGLAVIPAVIELAGRLLRPGGVLALEHDEVQREAVLGLLADPQFWTDAADHNDLSGRPRYATATRARGHGTISG